jgi:hypothetical protein
MNKKEGPEIIRTQDIVATRRPDFKEISRITELSAEHAGGSKQSSFIQQSSFKTSEWSSVDLQEKSMTKGQNETRQRDNENGLVKKKGEGLKGNEGRKEEHMFKEKEMKRREFLEETQKIEARYKDDCEQNQKVAEDHGQKDWKRLKNNSQKENTNVLNELKDDLKPKENTLKPENFKNPPIFGEILPKKDKDERKSPKTFEEQDDFFEKLDHFPTQEIISKKSEIILAESSAEEIDLEFFSESFPQSNPTREDPGLPPLPIKPKAPQLSIQDWIESRFQGTLVFNGETQCDSKQPEGFGNYKVQGRLLYEGEWKAGRFHGRGTLYLDLVPGTRRKDRVCHEDLSEFRELATRYEGDFSEGKIEGIGTVVFGSGQKYCGQVEDDMISGLGTFVEINEEKITGEWFENKLVEIY